jgi:hypothetical protein
VRARILVLAILAAAAVGDLADRALPQRVFGEPERPPAVVGDEAPPHREPPPPRPPRRLRLESTAYCLTGDMYDGTPAYDGAAAMRGDPPPVGLRLRLLTGPLAGKVVEVRDRIGHGSELDLAMPGRCREALDYGRKSVLVEVL